MLSDMQKEKISQGVKLNDVLPRGWVKGLAAEFGMARKNMALVLAEEINSDRAKLIRIDVKKRLIKYYKNVISELEQPSAASN